MFKPISFTITKRTPRTLSILPPTDRLIMVHRTEQAHKYLDKVRAASVEKGWGYDLSTLKGLTLAKERYVQSGLDDVVPDKD